MTFVPKKTLKLSESVISFFGKMSELFLFDQKVNSHKIMSKGFKFKFNYLTEALDDLIE